MSKLGLLFFALFIVHIRGDDDDDVYNTTTTEQPTDPPEGIRIDCTNEASDFKYKVIDDDDGPLIIFGDILDTESAVFCLRFESIFESYDFDKLQCETNDNSNTEIILKDQIFMYNAEEDCSAFTIQTTTENGVEISFNFEADLEDTIEPGFKYTFVLNNYIFNSKNDESYTEEDSKLIVKLKPEKCDDVYDIDSLEDSIDLSVNDGGARRRRRRRLIKFNRILLNSIDDDIDSDSDSIDRNEIGVSSDDSNDFDLDTLVFRNTPNATVICGESEDSESVVNVQMCYDDDSILLAFDSFGGEGQSCNVVQDPFALIDTHKYASNIVNGTTPSKPTSKGYRLSIWMVVCVMMFAIWFI